LLSRMSVQNRMAFARKASRASRTSGGSTVARLSRRRSGQMPRPHQFKSSARLREDTNRDFGFGAVRGGDKPKRVSTHSRWGGGILNDPPGAPLHDLYRELVPPGGASPVE
jgi:hypothetical protein